jgi:hypothetical protein
MFRTASAAAATMIALLAAAAPAHEFWIAPESGLVNPGQPIVADLKVGQMLRGEPYPYLSNRFARFTVTVGGAIRPVAGDEGDIPALAAMPAPPGLNVIAHETVAFRTTYDDWTVFRKYLADEGLDRFAELHRARGLPEKGFAERYTRYAKALVQVGPAMPGDGDVALGLPFELVVAANPYAPGLSALPVSLTWRGEPVAEHQITILRDTGETVTRSTIVTNLAGQAVIPLTPGSKYLLNAVRLEPIDQSPIVWQSHWASMSFDTRTAKQ